jgi:tight adherence protein B
MMDDILQRVDPSWLIFIGVFLGALLLIEGLRQLLSRRETNDEARSRRMRMVAAGTDIRERLDILVPRRDAKAGVGGLDLTGLLVAAGLPPRPGAFALAALIVAGAIALGLRPFLGLPVAGLLAAIVAFALPLLVLVAIREERAKRLVAQLPDALDLMARGLKAGHPLNTSIATVAETMPDPIGTEFGIVVDLVTYGDDVNTAMEKLSARNPNEDFRYLAAAIAIQHGSGGNLGRVLTILSQVIRGRMMMRRKIKAMSAEGRISALILSVIPFLMVGLNSIITPEYYGDIVDDPMFMPLAVVAVALIVTNALVMFKLVNFKI